MRAVDIIIRKRDHEELTTPEINFFVQGFTAGDIPDYQAAAFAMAVQLNGMTARETADLTLAMAASGDTLDLTGIVPLAVDKHSTGGVGDKTSLVAGPLAAACGLPLGKMSGRGLGFSGGTLDKLESIPGFRCDLSTQEFLAQLKDIGLVITGQTADLAPADGKLYALRDVTGTVPSIPLIASSIMSKKLAAGAQAICLDVKVGLGAFMTTLEDARTLAELMIAIARHAGRSAVALLSDMNQPLGRAVGNSLEVIEAIETLAGGGPDDFREHCLVLASHLLVLGQAAPDLTSARGKLETALGSGAALAKFRAMAAAQGGDPRFIDDPGRFPRARYIETVPAPRSGVLRTINARLVGEAAVRLGAGRAKKTDRIDHAVGLEILHRVGDAVTAGEPLFIIHANDPGRLAAEREAVLAAHEWSDAPVPPLPLFYGVVE